MKELKIGQRVRVTKEGYYNDRYHKGDIVYVVKISGEDTCPYYLSKFKVEKRDTFFAPYREAYVVVDNFTIGGKLL